VVIGDSTSFRGVRSLTLLRSPHDEFSSNLTRRGGFLNVILFDGEMVTFFVSSLPLPPTLDRVVTVRVNPFVLNFLIPGGPVSTSAADRLEDEDSPLEELSGVL